jgi:hypothetical protein
MFRLRSGGIPLNYKHLLQSVAAASLLCSMPAALADPWLAPGDLALRHDIQLLADEGIIRTPVTTWPMSWPDIARDVLAADAEASRNPLIDGALLRVQRAARTAAAVGPAGLELRVAGVGEPTELRTFSDTPRDEGEVSAAMSWLGERFAARLELTAAADPADNATLRMDNSYVGVSVGNFMVSAGLMQRWWGPGWDGSLILGTNARPIPSLTIERNYTDAFKTPWLRWVGPWRASLAVGQADRGDSARDGALTALPDVKYLAARVAFKPKPWLEVALTRSAQFCGEGRRCTLGTVSDLLLGRDNRDANLTINDEPGNQMAGYDLRVRSPWKKLPIAGYAQFIGEDEASGLPSKFLGLLGGEIWGSNRFGSWRLRGEFADSACTFTRSTPDFNCGYRNSLYPQGYTYRGRVIGHAMDNDGRMYSAAAMLVQPNGNSWHLLVRKVNLNRGGPTPDLTHALATGPAEVRNIEVEYNRGLKFETIGNGRLRIGLGFDDASGAVRRSSDVRGFIEWRQGF